MTRFLYDQLLRMHPPAFRRRFSAEMLWIFDETKHSVSASTLLLDCSVSLLRQWFLRSGLWKVAIATLGAFLQITAFGVFWHLLRHTHPTAHAATSLANAPNSLRQFTLWLAGGIVLLVAMIAASVRNLIAGRQVDRSGRRGLLT
jgi:hypothetical protein